MGHGKRPVELGPAAEVLGWLIVTAGRPPEHWLWGAGARSLLDLKHYLTLISTIGMGLSALELGALLGRCRSLQLQLHRGAGPACCAAQMLLTRTATRGNYKDNSHEHSTPRSGEQDALFPSRVSTGPVPRVACPGERGALFPVNKQA